MNKPKVLVLVPVRPGLNVELQAMCFSQACRLPLRNPSLDMCLVFDTREMGKEPGDCTAWSKVARVRNRLLRTVDWLSFNYIFWVDADLVEYPLDLPTRFVTRGELDPAGPPIQAPMVMVEGSERFYDTCGFIIKGASGIEPTRMSQIVGRNLVHHPPYWGPCEPKERVAEMDCVGSIYLVPTRVYHELQDLGANGVFHTDHPAFTDHFNVCQAAREMGRRVLVDRDVIAYHADLPKYGEAWH